MAKVKIQGNASGTGVLTVTAPNTSTDRTITLPDATGTLLNSDGDGSNLTGINLNAVTGNLTVSGNITGGNNGSIFLLDNAGQKSGEIQTDSSAANALQIDADPDNSASGSYTAFRVDNTERMRITPDGLTFNGDTAAANALSDYEEGTFTATLTSAPTAPTNPPTATGNYTKVGNWVHFTIFRFDNANTSGASGEMQITGLPFSAATSCITHDFATHSFNFDTTRYQWANIGSGSTTIGFLESSSGNAWSNWNITAGTGKYLTISGSYRTS